MTNLDSVLKNRRYFAYRGPCGQSYGFSSSRYGCESWSTKKAEHQRIGAFEMCCWRRLFESPLDSKEIKPVSPIGYQF